MNRKDELLGILQEECAEVIQAVSKRNRFGETAQNIADLHTEVGDVVGVLKMLMEEGYLDPERILTAGEAKVIKVEKYIKNKKPK